MISPASRCTNMLRVKDQVQIQTAPLIPFSLCSSFVCPNIGVVAIPDVDACECGSTEHRKRVLLWEKIFCLVGESNPRQHFPWLFSPALYPLNHPARSMSIRYSSVQLLVCEVRGPGTSDCTWMVCARLIVWRLKDYYCDADDKDDVDDDDDPNTQKNTMF